MSFWSFLKPAPVVIDTRPKVANVAKPVSLMPTNDEQYERHVKRMRRLALAMEQAVAKNDTRRINQLRAEMDSRQNACLAKGKELPDDIALLDTIIKTHGWSN